MFNHEAATSLISEIKESDLSVDQKIALAAVHAHLDQNDATREGLAISMRIAGINEDYVKFATEALDKMSRDLGL